MSLRVAVLTISDPSIFIASDQVEFIPVQFAGNQLDNYQLNNFEALIVVLEPGMPAIEEIAACPIPVLALVTPERASSLKYFRKLFDGVIVTNTPVPDGSTDILFLLPGKPIKSSASGNWPPKKTILLAGKPNENGVRWWGELIQLSAEYQLIKMTVSSVRTGMITVNLGGAALDVLNNGGCLLQPPEEMDVPDLFELGRDYWQWQPGALVSLLEELSANPEKLRITGEQVKKRFAEWRLIQLDNFDHGLSRIISSFDPEQKRRKLSEKEVKMLLAQWNWQCSLPDCWQRAGEQFNQVTTKPAVHAFNNAVIGLRKWLLHHETEQDQLFKTIDNNFRFAVENGLTGPKLALYRAILLASVQNWHEERGVLLSFLQNPTPDNLLEPEILLLPIFRLLSDVNCLKELWEHLGYCWEKFGYNGLTGISILKALSFNEDPNFGESWAYLVSKREIARAEVGTYPSPAGKDVSILKFG